MSIVVFHRNFQRFQGGHLKVFHYFEHVRSSPSHDARIRFTPDSVWTASNPWCGLRETVIDSGDTSLADVLFLSGPDWRSLEPDVRASSAVPIVNLIQGFRDTRLVAMRKFLPHRAIRLCVSPEIQETVEGAGIVEGPVITVPAGIDLECLPPPRPAEERDLDCIVLGTKHPNLARSIAGRLSSSGYRVMLVDHPVRRDALLDAMARARVTVHLPHPREGAYLPALESMALGAVVVCPDCVGNRSFCRDGETCLMPARGKRAILESARVALSASADELKPMRASAYQESRARSLTAERRRFLEILDDVHELWAAR